MERARKRNHTVALTNGRTEIYKICDFSKERISPPTKKQKWVRRTKAYY